MLAEDTDLTFRVYLAGYKVRYVNEAESYEEAVEDWQSYWRQRYRWALGHMQCAFKHLGPLIKSKNLRLREKIDGLLLLHVYFVPVLIGLAWILGAVSYFIYSPRWIASFCITLSIFAYSAVGNFAPFFEIGIGAYLDRRVRIYWLMPLLLPSFIYNVIICTKAFLDLSISRATGNKQHPWTKTLHNGRGNNYIL